MNECSTNQEEADAKRLRAMAALDEVRAAFAAPGLTLEELLESGRQIREELFREHYPELAKNLKPSGPHAGYDFGD